MRASSVLLWVGFGLCGAGGLIVACDMGSPAKVAGPVAKADSVEAGESEGGDDSGAPDMSDSAATEASDDVGTPVQPPPSGWLALVGGKGTFGQTYDDTNWNTRHVAGLDLYAVSCVTNVSGWVAGAGGFVAHTPDGGWSFSVETTPFTSDLRALRFSSETFGMVAGDDGALGLTIDGGEHWSAQAAGTTATLRGVAISPGAKTLVAVGDQATLVVSTNLGTTWRASSIVGAGNLRAVTADSSASVVLAVDDLGQIWSSHDGASSFGLEATARAGLEAVALSADASAAIAVGSNGTALTRFGTGSWSPVATGTSVDLHAAMIPWKDEQIYVAGDHGTLLTSLDHGVHFSRVTLEMSAPIYGLEDL